MSNYDSFAVHYDTLMGTREECVADVKKLLRLHAPRARTLLEIGCGTGSVLKQLQKKYKVAGIDLSREMLRIARKKLPNVPLRQMDMTKLAGMGSFDVALCLFDTMNHLPKFSQWKRAIRCAHAALNPGGVFIFDINTQFGLEQYSITPTFAEIERQGVSVFDANALGGGKYRLDLHLFKKQRDGSYKLHKTSIHELAVPTARVLAAARAVFPKVSIWDAERGRASKKSAELYFICRK